MEPASGGFELFAQSIKRKMNWSVHLDPFSHVLRDAARPAWQKLARHEKEEWLARARELERTEQQRAERQQQPQPARGRRGGGRTFNGGGGNGGGRLRTTRNVHFRGVMEEEQEAEDEEEFEFAGAARVAEEDTPRPLAPPDVWMAEKQTRDRERVAGWIEGMTRKQIVELRWLILSAQTFGRNDKECLLAEVALDEFTLQEGVLDRMSSLVADWPVDNAILESRAIFHSNETHGIALDHKDPEIDKVQLIAEILGRAEPEIAKEQSISVGLYRAQAECGLPVLDGFMLEDPSIHFVSDARRRPILVLRHEYYAAAESLASFKRRMRLDYDGFPIDESRFILAEAFLEAVATALGGETPGKVAQFLGELGKPLDADFATQWEKRDELFCGFHAPLRNACCAAVTAARAIFIMIYSIEKLIRDASF